MGDQNMLLTIIQNFTSFVTGPTGKAILLAIIITCGLSLWMGKFNKHWLWGIIIGSVLIFSASFVASTFFGISAG